MVREPTIGGCPDGRKDGTPEQPGDGGDALGSARQSPKLKLLIKKIIMNKSKTIGILLLSFIIIASSCKQDKIAKKESSTKKEAKKKSVKIPVFNGDSAFAFVKKQVDFGPRVQEVKRIRKLNNGLLTNSNLTVLKWKYRNSKLNSPTALLLMQLIS
jgi:hypothetical protein